MGLGERVVTDVPADTEESWFYTHRGQRNGPVAAGKLAELLVSQTIDADTPVWRKGQGDWKPLRETELSVLVKDEPPPIASSHINNGLVWTIAIAPIAYAFFGATIAAYQASNPYQDHSIASLLSWLVPAGVNATLCLLDERQLNRAGYASGWITFFAVVLAPVYLFVRAQQLRQTPAYGFVWIASFILSLILSA